MVDDPTEVAHEMLRGIERVREHRIAQHDAFFFNWALKIPFEFQLPFKPTHEAMAALNLHKERDPHMLAADLRRAFSGIVAGNVKEEGLHQIDKKGPFVIDGDPQIMHALDALLRSFVAQHRMKLPGREYVPCYRIAGAKETAKA